MNAGTDRQPIGTETVRRSNLSLVLKLLADRGPHSRAGLAAASGLTKATVSALADELIATGLVAELPDPDRPDGARRAGRPATMLTAATGKVVAIGAEIGIASLTAVAADLVGTVHHREVRSFDQGASAPAVLRELAAIIARLAKRASGAGRTIVGLGVAVPGLVDVAAGRALVAPNLGWYDVDVTATLRRALARHRVGYLANSVTVDNEADLAAIAHHRARGGPSSFVYVSAGVGVGGGVIVDGAVFRGAHGFAGELGHFVVRPGGRRCGCGNRGCLETEIGLAAVMRRTRTSSTEQLLDRLTGPRGTTELSRLSTTLATAIGPVLNLFDPESVVLGGYLGPLTDLLRDELQSHLSRLVLGSRWAGYTIDASAAGHDAASVGAALCALRPVVDDPRQLVELTRLR